ncbi:MAG: CoA transferase [Trueperaceae bacterium]|nr:CoA transferase [Trueperaceae bacterium]MCO5173651.1 CoA transferase [Trueperaceae bacterium]MCW5820575.1 CoA transferase [Trueperaceae bacterium]
MLDDLLVLDLTRVLAGPYCTLLFSDLGARVVKVESPSGDDTRRWGPPYPGGESGYYLSVNRGKESVVVDLKDERGAAVVRGLARKADVIVENFKVGDLERYGLDHASVAATNPRVVYVSITGFGQDGPRAKEPGYDAAMQAQSGLLAMTGEPDGPPVKLGVAWIDVLTGLHAATGALAALHRRERTGEGARLDVSLFDVALASLVNQAQNALLTGEVPPRLGSAHPTIVPYQSFEAADGGVVVAVGNDGQFARLCAVLGTGELAADPRFATNDGRVANRSALVPLLADVIRQRRAAELLAACRSAGVPATPVTTLPDALADEQATARGMVVEGAHPTIGALPMVASPLWHAQGPDGRSLGLAPAPGAAPVPPLLAQHTRAVLERELGLSAAEIDALAAAGVVRVLG